MLERRRRQSWPRSRTVTSTSSPASVLPVMISNSREPPGHLAHGLKGVENRVENHLLEST